MIDKMRSEIAAFDLNFRGPRLRDNVVVFESDDWGAFRMKDKRSYDNLRAAGIPVDRSVYCKFDCLETSKDLLLLREVLETHKNREGYKPRFTLNFVSCNPDFKKIKEANFDEYYSRPISEGYRYSKGSEGALDIVKSGTKGGLWLPQFHGRDHVNVPMWLSLLKTDTAFRKAFDEEVWGLSLDVFPKMTKSIQATYDSTDLAYTTCSVNEGLDTFESLFGFKSKSFIANNYIWDKALFALLWDKGVRHIQTMKYQLLPQKGEQKRTPIRRVFGSRNSEGQTFAPRNVLFEPTECGHSHLDTLKQIKRAFDYGKPAIISTHRINYVSGMSIRNRDQNLKELSLLLEAIIKRWPEVRFQTSDQLHDTILDTTRK